MAKKKKTTGSNVAAENRKARYHYEIMDTLEAGLALTGTEVKSLRAGKASIAESYATEEGGELWLINSNLPEYLQANRFNHDPKRPRRLLLHKKELRDMWDAVRQKGVTIVPTKLYFKKGRAKLEIALAKGKKLHDKREAIAERDQAREAAREMRGD